MCNIEFTLGALSTPPAKTTYFQDVEFFVTIETLRTIMHRKVFGFVQKSPVRVGLYNIEFTLGGLSTPPPP